MPKLGPLRYDRGLAKGGDNCHNERHFRSLAIVLRVAERVGALRPPTGRRRTCRPARPSSTCSATTCARTAAAPRWPRWSSCSRRWASRPRRYAPRCPGWSGRAGCTRCGCPAGRVTCSPRRRSAGWTSRPPGSTGPTRSPGTAPSTCCSSRRPGPAPTGSGSPPAWPSSATAASPTTPGSPPARRRRPPPCWPRRASGTSGSAPGTPAAPRAPPRWSAAPGTWRRWAARTGGSWCELRPVVATVAGQDDEAAYAARFQLVHAWRTFLFRDPQLAARAAAVTVAGDAAAEFFDEHAGRLRPAADRYVAARLEQASRPGPTRRGAGHPARPEPAHRR